VARKLNFLVAINSGWSAHLRRLIGNKHAEQPASPWFVRGISIHSFQVPLPGLAPGLGVKTFA
jgi:hypothetical protein